MERRPLGPLGLRFAAAFVGVALLAVGLFSVAVLVADQRNVAHLASTERDRTTAQAAALAASAYRAAGGWAAADVRSIGALAAQVGVGVEVRDGAGIKRLDSEAPPIAGSAAPMVVARPVVVDDRMVGSVAVEFADGGARAGEGHLQASLFAAVGWSAALAAAAALIVGLVVAEGVVRPVRRLASAVESMRLGGTVPRIGSAAGPGELGDLGRAFDTMADSLEREDQLRRTLVADVAHELRTPVAIMQAETEALSDGITAPSPAALASLHEEAVRLARLVGDLQTMAAAQAAGLELIRRPLDLGRVAADATQSLAPRFQEGRIELYQDLPPTRANGDPHRLHQVVVNLLTNAAKFTPPGGTVAIRTYTDAADAVLELSDTGPGIPESERDAIWERFYQGRSGRASVGSGIGLAVVRELVAAHGGTVSVSGSPGGGATFVVRLPTPSDAGSAGPSPAPAATPAGAAPA